jgi:hypothetical protein
MQTRGCFARGVLHPQHRGAATLPTFVVEMTVGKAHLVLSILTPRFARACCFSPALGSPLWPPCSQKSRVALGDGCRV